MSRLGGSSHYSGRSMSQFITSSDAEDLTDGELVKQVETLKNQIKILSIENEILENAVIRIDPNLMVEVQRALEYALKIHSQASMGNLGSFGSRNPSKFGFPSESLVSPSSRVFASASKVLTSPSRLSTKRAESSARIGTTFGSGPKINILERSELVSTELTLLVKKLQKYRNQGAREQALFNAQLEEIDYRVREIEKSTETFNNEVIIGGWDKIAQRIPAEVWIRYMKEWVKLSDKEISKLRLRTSTLNAMYTRLKGQIKLKSELHESLRPVDFEKQAILNKVCLDQVERKGRQIGDLKRLAGDASLNLANHKKALMDQDLYLKKVEKEIENRKSHTTKLDGERQMIAVEAESLQIKLGEVRRARLAHEVPQIVEYCRVKAEVRELKLQIKRLENRHRVQLIALKSLNKRLGSMIHI